ncbi:MAG: DUF3313 domain-containing protein [Alphaproteobacteria bacterium]|nr:DUF3313 domain-containing protein [Alphaproteobacteria bacterium]
MVSIRKFVTPVMAVAMLGALSAAAYAQSQFSGFLRDYSNLKDDPMGLAQYYYQNPDKDVKTYTKFVVDPIVVHFKPNAKGTSIDAAKLGEVASYMQNKVIGILSQRFEVVDRSGPGVARLRAAITSVEQTEPVLNIHPLMRLSGMGLGGAAMEAEMVDSVSGETIIAAADERAGNRMGITAGFESLGHAYQVIDRWGENLEKRIDAIYGPK